MNSKMNYTPKDNRNLNHGEVVEVYRNLHKDTLSIRGNNLVKGYSDMIFIGGGKFVVREGGRNKVLKTGKKNVHAFVKGEVKSCYQFKESDIESLYKHMDDNDNIFTRVYYNPFKFSSFVTKGLDGNFKPIHNHEKDIIVILDRVYICN